MATLREYVVEYHYYGKQNGKYWDEVKTHTVTAHSKAEARRIFDEWHNEHGAVRDYKRGQPILRHPFAISITTATVDDVQNQSGTKDWLVTYDHSYNPKDGRKGTVKVTTTVEDSECFKYGNGKCGSITCEETEHIYDLRYETEPDLHMVMIKDHFGKGLVKAERI